MDILLIIPATTDREMVLMPTIEAPANGIGRSPHSDPGE
jgi:hypothetical protein